MRVGKRLQKVRVCVTDADRLEKALRGEKGADDCAGGVWEDIWRR